MEINGKIAYEVALQRLLQKEKEVVELLALYTEALQKIERLENGGQEGE